MKLRAEANILSRTNERLKAEKATDAARVSALQQEVRALHQQLTDAGSVADKLRAELGERDGVISDTYVSMQGLRRRVQELETHKVRSAGACLGWLCGLSDAEHSKRLAGVEPFRTCTKPHGFQGLQPAPELPKAQTHQQQIVKNSLHARS